MITIARAGVAIAIAIAAASAAVAADATIFYWYIRWIAQRISIWEKVLIFNILIDKLQKQNRRKKTPQI